MRSLLTRLRSDSRRASRSGRNQRGAALVEGALVMLPLMILSLGVFDLALMIKESSSIEAATRDGARAAQVRPKSSTFYSSILGEVKSRGVASSFQVGDRLFIYKAGTNGYPVGNTSAAAKTNPTCTTSCQEYRWLGTAFSAQVAGSGWDVTTQKTCLGGSDTVGVLIIHQYKSRTGFASFLNRNQIEHSTSTLEPLNELC